jgi:NitT/TauT family transport system ATP-binding protein
VALRSKVARLLNVGKPSMDVEKWAEAERESLSETVSS